MKKQSIQKTISQSTLLVLIIPFIVLCIIPSLLTFNQLHKNMISECRLLLNASEAELTTFVAKTNKEFDFFRNNLIMTYKRSLFNTSIDFSNFFQNIYRVELLDNTGKITANMPKNKDVIGFDKSLSYDFTTAHMNNTLYDGRVFYDTTIEAPAISWGTQMENGSVLVAYLNLDSLNTFLVQCTKGHPHSIALIDNKGTYIANSDPTHVYTRNVDSYYHDFINQKLSLEGKEKLRINGESVTPVGKIFSGHQWLLVTYASRETFNKALIPYLATYVGLSLLVSLILIYMLKRKFFSIGHSINDLAVLTHDLVEGDFEHHHYKTTFRELDIIYMHFITLVNDSTNRIREFSILNNELESRVVERTIALENSIAALKSAQQELIQKEKVSSMVTLASGITQEMNTPLSIANTLTIHLKESITELNPENTQDVQADLLASIDVLERNLYFTASLLNRFKNMTGASHQTVTDIFNLEHLLDNLHILHSPLLSRHDATLIYATSDSFRIKGDPGIFEQLFSLLIVNSVEHGFEHRHHNEINIHLSKKNNTLAIDYHDNGKGILKEHQTQVFDPFFTTARDQGSIGLGLSTLYSLVTATLGGQIKLTSSENRGVDFQISIPLLGEDNIAGFYSIKPLETFKS